MYRVHVILFATLVVASCLAIAPDQPQKTFQIGMTQQEMHTAFGEPHAYLEVRSQHHLTRAEFLAAGGRCFCRPLYSRKTARNEYEIVIFETVDESTSHLHTTIRVEAVRFKLDHDMAPEAALADIAEANALCAGKCVFSQSALGGLTAIRPGANVQFYFGTGAIPGQVQYVEMAEKK